FNCSTNIAGGGVQNAANFIWHAIQDHRFDWIFAISPQVKEVLSKWNSIPDKATIFESPARNASARNALRSFALENNVNLVYTMAGPAYIRFHSPHVLGVSNPYVTHGSWEAFSFDRSFVEIGSTVLRAVYRGFHAR